jgi:F-type H+-transporting ATPase subunit delta
MKAPRKRVASVIAKQSLSNGFDHKQALSVAAYLLDERRTGELDSLMRDVQADWAADGFVEVIVYSAHELSDQVRRDVSAEARKLYPHAKRVELTQEINPDLIGGIRLEFSNRQLDLSVQSELNKFKLLAVNGKD